MKLKFVVPEESERRFFYTDSTTPFAKACIGYLRIDFDRNGFGFYHNWFPKNQPLNTPEFRKEFDAVINKLRHDLLSGRKGMAQFNREHEGLNVDFDLARGNGYRVETENRVYFLRCTPLRGDYDCYCYCYDKALFEEVLAEEQAQEPDMEMGVMQ